MFPEAPGGTERYFEQRTVAFGKAGLGLANFEPCFPLCLVAGTWYRGMLIVDKFCMGLSEPDGSPTS